MNYYETLGLKKEPFSTSPDPAFFYMSSAHKAALYRLQIAITLKRGLCVLLGDVGTGKTSLSRKLAQILGEDENVMFHMILNPYFRGEEQFLRHLTKLFHLDPLPENATGMELMQAIERFLFQKGVVEGKTVILLVDESQLVPDYVFEMLRILLNYETNEFKILQLVLVGQLELLPRLRAMHNFWDRIALKYVINPLDEPEVKRTVEFRLQQAGYVGSGLFTDEAMDLIHKHTQGYPRKFTLLCHNALENLVMYDQQIVDAEVVRRLIVTNMESINVKVGDTANAG